MNLLSLSVISSLTRLPLRAPLPWEILNRTISLNSCLPFRATPALLAEPLKKKKKLDPAVVRQREERKKRKIEKQIRKLERNSRQLKPIEECEVPLEVYDGKEKHERQFAPLSMELVDIRELLHKKWSNYKCNQHLEDVQTLDRLTFAQQKALDELRGESEELYQEALQPDFQLMPFNAQGPVETPPIEGYDAVDGDYQDVSRVW